MKANPTPQPPEASTAPDKGLLGVVLPRLVRNILPVTIAVLSWVGIGIAFLFFGSLLLAMLIPMSPLIAIALAWEFWRKPVANWWGRQFEKGCKIIVPNDQTQQLGGGK